MSNYHMHFVELFLHLDSCYFIFVHNELTAFLFFYLRGPNSDCPERFPQKEPKKKGWPHVLLNKSTDAQTDH